MNSGKSIHTLHRYVGIVIAPFLVLQTLSGLLLDFGLFGRARGEPGAEAVPDRWDPWLTKIHFGAGLASDLYHLALGAGILWMAVSGWILYLQIRRARNRRPSA